MSSPDRPLLADLKANIRSLTDDVRETLQLRWELARLEIQADLARLKCLVFIWGIAAVMALTALPLLATALADTLDGWHGIARRGWLLIFGLALLGVAVISAYGCWLWFRRRFIGLQESLEELREDLEWAKETTNAEDRTQNDK
jgi:type VI protein secretion system component VasK